MSAHLGFTADDAERQAAESAARYLGRALHTTAARLGLEKTLERDPAGFADKFAPLVSALIAAQTREYQSWVLFSRLGELERTLHHLLIEVSERGQDANQKGRDSGATEGVRP